MCGIFGIVVGKKAQLSKLAFRKLTEQLFKLSESRGKEAAGMAIKADQLYIYKAPVSADELLKSRDYKKIIKESLAHAGQAEQIEQPFCLYGHSRLVTNGFQGINENNQPVIKSGVVGVHNGIIVNIDELWKKHGKPDTHLDSEIIFYLLREHFSKSGDLPTAVKETYKELYGMASIACTFDDLPYLLLATNNGSLYVYYDLEHDLLIFASEEFILKTLLENSHLKDLNKGKLKHLRANEACMINLETMQADFFDFTEVSEPEEKPQILLNKTRIFDVSNLAVEARNEMVRCSRCILPETMPFIRFDEEGVCNYCRSYQKTERHGEEALKQRITPFRQKNDKIDSIFAFSGGRDSSYGLHYIVTELGMKPVAYTYDWGMVTDLARRNQSRLCSKLGIEHILVSADIRKKRKNIRKNVLAWLKKPDLGMVPIFMAGDKQYITYPMDIRKKTGAELVFFCRNQLEKTGFKTGFCGLDEGSKWYYQISLKDKMKLVSYYLRQYLTNPAYFNSSLLDSVAGFYASFLVDRSNYVQLFNYIPWDEPKMMQVLKDEYDWEFAGDTESSWRIGDGTAAFYNYIYYTIAGFSENDTFRSNQIREGMISREDALQQAKQDNQPRYESIREYANIIGFDCDEALFVINSMPKLYMKG